jgi:hypothetical protein
VEAESPFPLERRAVIVSDGTGPGHLVAVGRRPDQR